MIKHLRNILLFGTIILMLAACSTPTPQPTAIPTQKIEITSTPIVIVVTATPMPATATQDLPEETPTANVEPATNTPEPTKVYPTAIPGAYNDAGSPIKSDDSIIITNIKETGTGQALMTWTASGTFSNGFRIYYSSYIKNPVFGGEKSEFVINDGATRSAYISGDTGTTYYYRICNYTGSGCAFYSNTFTFSFSGPTPTP